MEEALKIKRDDCEGTVDVCAKCPIGKRLFVNGEGAGFDMVFTVCGIMNLLDDCLSGDYDYTYKPEY